MTENGEPRDPDPNTSGRFVGLVFMTIGVLWIVLTGLCAFTLIGIVLDEGPDPREVWTIAAIAIPSAVIGLGAFIFGRLLRPKREKTKS